jgi:hypothetical protein
MGARRSKWARNNIARFAVTILPQQDGEVTAVNFSVQCVVFIYVLDFIMVSK